jgi:transposase
MAYREVRMIDIEQAIRRWLAGESIRAVARSTGLDRNTVRRLIRLGQRTGLKPGDAWPNEGKLQAIRERMGRPGASREQGPIEQALLARQPQIQSWLKEDRLILTKIHELLGREGLTVPYPTLHRFARKHCGFGKPAGTVRRIEGKPGEFAEVDFGQLGLLQELGSGRRRVVHGFMMVLGYSRLNCVVPVFRQDLITIIDCFEQALEFFDGCPRRIVIDGMKACLDNADPCTPRFNRTFLEYANYRGFLPDPARPRHPKDKPVIENTVRFVRERFFKGETFIDLDDVARRALVWCRDTAGRRIHGTTRRVPIEVFETEEKPVLIPLQAGRFDPPHWTDCKIHPDHHVRVDGALYSVPSRWQAGSKVQVRADRALVRIYIHGELIKTHERKPRGGRSTDYNDYPDGKAPYAMRWPNFYCKRARDLGPSVGDFADQLLSGEFPWSRLRSAQKLLGLAERYGAARLDAACRRALRFELLDVYGVERILQQGLEHDPTPEPVTGHQAPLDLKFLRPAHHFVHTTGGSDVDPA